MEAYGEMTKRANAEGSIYQRKDGRWVSALSLPTGKRKSFYAKTRREVQLRLVKAQNDTQSGLTVVGEKQTVAQFLDRWLTESVKATVRPRTYSSYSDLVRLHIKPVLGKTSIARLTPQQIQGLLNAKLQAGLSTSTVKYIHAVLRRALGQAYRWGIVARNAAALVDPPRVRHEEVSIMDPAQARAFLDAISGHRLEALYSVALAVGLRQGEALGLRWDDVNLESGQLEVRKQLQRLDSQYRLVEPKTNKSRRTLDLPGFAVDSLRQHRVHQIEERLAAGGDWEEWGLVFTTRRGTPLDAKNVTHRFQEFLARNNLPRMRFHDLRHACASLLLAQGEQARVVMEILGHSQISMTMNTYSHVIPALRREAARRMDTLLSEAT
jgi:integrase